MRAVRAGKTSFIIIIAILAVFPDSSAALNTVLDTSFRAELVPVNPGTLPGSVRQMKALPTGDLLVAGDFFPCKLPGLIRFRPDGTVDRTFPGVFTWVAYGFNLDSEGNIVAIGANETYLDEVVKLRPDGSPDSAFSPPHFLSPNDINGVNLLPDDSVLLSGDLKTTAGTFGSLRLNRDGTIDKNWKDNFMPADSILAPDGSFYGFGSTVAHFLADGTQDPAYHAPEFSSCDFSGCNVYRGLSKVALDSTGKLIVAGNFQVASIDNVRTWISPPIVRLLENGRLDSTFRPTLSWLGPASSQAIGDFIMLSDTEFVVGAGHMALAADGKIYLGTDFSSAPLVRYFGFYDPERPPALTIDSTQEGLNLHVAGGARAKIDLEVSEDLEKWNALASLTNYSGFFSVSLRFGELRDFAFFRVRQR